VGKRRRIDGVATQAPHHPPHRVAWAHHRTPRFTWYPSLALSFVGYSVGLPFQFIYICICIFIFIIYILFIIYLFIYLGF
jgi:hypothetical protein